MTAKTASKMLQNISTTLTKEGEITLQNDRWIQEAIRRGSLALLQDWENLPEEVQLNLRQQELKEMKK